MEVAFIHAPQNIMRESPPHFYIMPMGMIMAANLVNERGFTSQVFHLGIEKEEGSSPEQVISEIDALMFAIDIHWYVHLYDAVTVAAVCKRLHPHAIILVGGMTASCFAQDLVSQFPFIDYVIRGDAEVPLMKMVEAYDRGSLFTHIPNLTYMRGKQVVQSPLQYVAGSEDISGLPYVSDPLPIHLGDTYLHKEMAGESCFPSFWFCCGRGCMFNCCWCGGASSAHERLTGRGSMIYRNPENVAHDIMMLASRLNMASFSHDVIAMGRHYSSRLFSLIKKENLDIGAYWEVFDPSLYSKKTLLEFALTFNPQRSKIAVSLGSAVPEVRDKSGMAAFSNDQLYQMLKNARDLGIQVEGYFHILPQETYETFETTLRFVNSIQKELKVPFFYWSATLDPESPMYAAPEAFGLTSRLHHLSDYWHACCKGEPFVGYDLANFLEKDMLTLSRTRTEEMPEGIASLYNSVIAERNRLIGLQADTDISSETLFI